MASLKEHVMYQLSLVLHQRLFSAAQEILEQVKRTLDGEDLKPELDFQSTISAAPQVGITLADGNQPIAPPATHEAPLSPNGGDSAQNQLLEIKQEATDFTPAQDSVEHFFEDVEGSQPERDGVQADFASDSDHRVHPSRNLKIQGSVKEEEVTQSREWLHCCGVCGKGFRFKSYLKAHERTHTGERPYPCDICKKTFARNCDLKKHKKTHTGEKPYRCDVCEKSFIQSSDLKIHKRTHTGERPYRCDVCEKSYIQSSDLKIHKRTHTGERPYRCDVCEKSFTQSSDLKIHKRTHTGERPYRCDVCEKSYIQSSDLKIHKRTHTGERPYRCDVCEKSFTQSSDLKIHKRTHTGEKPYRCDVCEKSFTQSGHLKIHKRTHTGEKPYLCDVCGKAFRQNAYLKRHKCPPIAKSVSCGEAPAEDTTLKRKEETTKFSCAYCGRQFLCGSSLSSHQKHLQGVKSFICDVCSLVFCQDTHNTREHTAEAKATLTA